MHANQREEIDTVYAGDIAAAVGLKETFTGDTLSDPDHPIVLESIVFPEPVIEVAIEPKTKADQDKLAMALQRLAEEDPTFRVHTDEESGQTRIAGMGELHLDVLVDRMIREFKVAANVGRPAVAYRETIRRAARATTATSSRPAARASTATSSSGSSPTSRARATSSSTRSSAAPSRGNTSSPSTWASARRSRRDRTPAIPMVDVRSTLFDGSFHEVDSSEMAFRIAASMALKEAVAKASPVILEPLMRVEVTMPEQFLGDVIGDLNARRGHVEAMESRGSTQVVRARVPWPRCSATPRTCGR